MKTPIDSQLKTDLSLVRRAADRLLAHRWKEWFWANGIGFEGLLDATELTGDEKYFGYVYGFFKAWIPRMEDLVKFDAPVTNGRMSLPECTGLGIDLNEDPIRKWSGTKSANPRPR